MSDERDEIRSRIDIVELVGSRVALRRTGKTYKGLCPFHDDKNPSFTVDPTTGRYRCWSCGEHGDCFTWVMKTGNVDFPEALKELAAKAGVELKSRGPSAPPGQRDAHRAAMLEALAFFRESLGRSAAAREYVARRGLDQTAIDGWEIGFAPDSFEALTHRLRSKGHDLVEAKALFLVDERDKGGYYDKFRGRLMFPIRDERGELVAFGGRLLGDGQPKYINSSDTPLYRKSRVLYGFDHAKDAIAKSRRAVLVEGYLDVIACHRAEEATAVASLGTALSEEHAKLLKRWVDEVTILYDADAAGQKAAERAVGLLRDEGVRVRVALMPEGEDPDTLLRKAGGAAVRKAVEGGLSPLDFAVGQLETKHGPDEEEFWEAVVALLSAAPPGLDVERHLDRLSGLYPGLRDPSAARRRLESMVAERRPPPTKPERRTPTRRPFERKGEKREQPPEPTLSPEEPPPALRERLNNIEATLFRAFYVPEFLRTAWMFARMESLFLTGAGVELSRAIRSAFPDGPPEGKPAVWLARLPDREATMMADLNDRLLPEPMSEEELVGAIERLKRLMTRRDLERRRKGLAEGDLGAWHLENKALNPDEKATEPDDDEDPFA